jgi:hypothetical protein
LQAGRQQSAIRGIFAQNKLKLIQQFRATR